MATTLITTTEAAATLGLSRQGVLHLVETGKLAYERRIGPRQQYLFDSRVVELLRDERKTVAAS